MRELLAGLCNFLRHTQLQTQQIQWQLVNTRGNRSVLDVRSQSAGQDLECWLALSQLRLDAMTKHIRDIEGLVLNVEQLTPQNHTTEDLLSDRGQREPIQALVDRLRNRLGLQAIHHVNSRPEHLPEHCSYTDTERADPPTPIPHGTQRPFWLLSQPQPIQRRQGQLYWHGPLKVLHGPERIEDNWWQSPVSRDYYIAQGENGEPLWIFQNRHSRRWYLHGLFD